MCMGHLAQQQQYEQDGPGDDAIAGRIRTAPAATHSATARIGIEQRFSRRNIAEDEDVLTTFSRIGNNSLLPLPYPLVHVSLTDRWEEIIGSRVLMPNEYLAGDLDPSRPVIPGENFTAVITIDEPSDDATGFKLNVCYRVSPGRVRCATEDFKD